jgi:hypothetical protein
MTMPVKKALRRLWLEIKLYDDLKLSLLTSTVGLFLMVSYIRRGEWVEVMHSSVLLWLGYYAWTNYRRAVKRFHQIISLLFWAIEEKDKK